jgi:subtilisin family serine protease
MATPHLAGAAAVVRGIHPSWTAAEVRSAIVNTAQEGVLRHPETGDVTDDALIVGAGLLDVSAASSATTALDPVSQSFGSVASGGGRSRSSSIQVTNLSGSTTTFTVAVADTDADDVLFSTTGGTFTLAPGASRSVSVSMAAKRGAADGHYQAVLRVTTSGTEVAHAMLYTLVGEGDRAPGQHMLPPPKA